MRTLPLFLAIVLASSAASAAEPRVVAHYRIDEGPDVGGQLVLFADGTFGYELAAGALDERARGRWEKIAGQYCLTTDPTPVPPSFALAPRGTAEAGAPTLLVTWPNGRGIAGVDFRLGFAEGEPVADYTQEDGWTLPPDDRRVPAWIELAEPVHDTRSPRFALDPAQRGTIVAVLTPNDIGVVDFRHACIAPRKGGAALRRGEGEMRLVKVKW